jgi:hypothetical protein
MSCTRTCLSVDRLKLFLGVFGYIFWVYLGKKSRRSTRLEILVKHFILYSMSQIWRNHLICLTYQIYAKNVYIGLTMFQSLKFRCKRWFYMMSKKKLQLKHKNSLFTLQTFHYNNYWWSQSLLNRFGWEIYAFQS